MLTIYTNRPPAWKTLYGLEAANILLFAGFLPAVAAIVRVYGSSALLPAASVYAGIVLFVQRRAIDWKCPRCGKAFLRAPGNGFAVPFRTACGSCGLKRGSLRL